MAWRRCWCLAILICVGSTSFEVAADEPAAAESAAEKPPAEAASDEAIAPFTGDANDPKALEEYAGAQFGKVIASLQSNPDLAEKQVDALVAILNALKVENNMSRRLVAQINGVARQVHERAPALRVTVDELKKQLDAAPDAKTVNLYVGKIRQVLGELADSDAAAAEKQLAEARDYLQALAEKSEDKDLKAAVEGSERPFSMLERSIQSEKKLAELIGKDAAPLEVSAWANGGPLTAESLKGKVVLLDFWAVWCGPCIMTFPHLQEWYAQYHDKGLEIVGVTGYYNFKWDDAKGKADRAGEGETVSHEDEQAMLVKFAELHKLAHPFAIQEDRTLAEYYGVTGIPHVVLVDRAGKIRMIKVGSGPANAKAIGDEIEKLIAE